jgi:enoyl-CoA hydratase
MSEKYPAYKGLKLDWPAARVLRITIARGKANAMDYELHHDITTIWRLIEDDSDVSAVILTGEGRFFSAGGDFDMEKQIVSEFEMQLKLWKDGRDLVRNIVNCSKPIVAAINGPAAGGGLAAAMLSDVTIAARSAKIVDGHTRLGVVAGDHASIIWPLLCGMAKAKYYLMTCESLSAEEAERIGLITMVADDDKLQESAVQVATKLAQLAPTATRLTKYSLNNWLRVAWPIFDTSIALEMMSFGGPEAKEGLAAHLEKRTPNFNPFSPV